MGQDFRLSFQTDTVQPPLLSENTLKDLLVTVDPSFSLEERAGNIYRDKTEYLLSLAKYGFVFLAKPCCMDKQTTIATLQDMSKAALLERIIPNYVAPESLQQTAFVSASAYVKSHVATPFAVSLDFNTFNIKDILTLHAEYISLLKDHLQRKEKLNSELEHITKTYTSNLSQSNQGLHAKFKNLEKEREDTLKKLELEFQGKRNKLNQLHDKEVKKLEQELHLDLNAISCSFKSDLKHLEQELPAKLDELDRAYKQEIKNIEFRMFSKADHIDSTQHKERKNLVQAQKAELKETYAQSVAYSSDAAVKLSKLREDHTQKRVEVTNFHSQQLSFLREYVNQQREELKQEHNHRCDEVRKAHSKRQLEVRAIFKQQQVDIRLAHVKKLEDLRLQHKQNHIKLDNLYTEQKGAILAVLNQKRQDLSTGDQGNSSALMSQYEKDCALVQSKIAALNVQHNQVLANFHASLTKKLYELKEQTVGLIKREFDFTIDWQGFWDEEVESFNGFLNRSLSLCFVGEILKGIVRALSDTIVVTNNYHQNHVSTEAKSILDSLLRLIPSLLSGGLNRLHNAVASIFNLLPAQSVVLYLHEFDQMFVRTFANSFVCELVIQAMRDLCDSLSSTSSHIKFALMTGITKFSKTASDLGLGNFVNLSESMGFSYEQSNESDIYFNEGAKGA